MASTTVGFDIIAKDRASDKFDKVGKSADRAGSRMGGFGRVAKTAALGIGAVAGAAAVFAYKVGSDYVGNLNKIQALTGANNAQMDAAAKQLESNTSKYAKMGQTVGDASTGVIELAKSGLSLKDSLKAVYGTMVLAKAGEMSVADAAAVTSNALNTFGLKAKDAGKVANYLANAANISSADVSDLAESLKYVAPVAASAGVSIQQTSALMAELANAGIKGSSAGTALRTFLLNLQAPTAAAGKEMQALGVNIYTATGKMKPIGTVIGTLSDKINHLTPERASVALKNLFGKVGIAGATTILHQGVKGFKEYTKGIEKAGSAAKLAAANSKGLGGTLHMFGADIVSTAQMLYRKFSPAVNDVLLGLAGKVSDAFHNIKWGDLGKKVTDAFKGIHIAQLGEGLAKQAKGWAVPVINGFKQGLNAGDWSGLGKALGGGVVKALAGLGSLAGKLTDQFNKIMSKVDWVGIGIAMGKEAPALAIGLAAGLLNFDLMGLLKGLGKHWGDVLLAVIAVAFTPVRIIGKVAEVLSKIPFAGKMLAWALVHFKVFSDGLGKQALRAVGFLGKAFLAGFRRVFPEVGAKFASSLRILPTRLGVMAIELQAKGARMIVGLGRAIAGKIGGVVAKLGELIARMLRPFANAGSWLVSKGAALMGGMAKGIGSRIGDVLTPVRSLGSKIISAMSGAGSWLLGAGRAVVQGLMSGIDSMAGSLIGKAQALASTVKNAFKGALGIHSPSRVFMKLGINIMEGLSIGLDKGTTLVKNALDKVLAYLSNQRSKMKSLLGAKSSFAQGFQSFTSSVFGADLSHKSTDSSGNETSTPGTIADMLAYQTQQRTKARQLRGDVKKLHKLGLSDALIRQLEASGESGLEQIHTLAGGNRKQIRELNSLNAETAGALAGAGNIAGSQLYNSAIARTRNNEDLAERIAKKLRQALHEAKKDERVVIEDASGQWIIKAIRKEKRHQGKASAV